MDRRTVIKALMGGLAFPVVPIQIEAAAKKLNRRIILIELQGANDGLNTIIPYMDPNYKKLRPKIHLKKDEIIPVENDLAFNNSMENMVDIWNSGELAIVLGLGLSLIHI